MRIILAFSLAFTIGILFSCKNSAPRDCKCKEYKPNNTPKDQPQSENYFMSRYELGNHRIFELEELLKLLEDQHYVRECKLNRNCYELKSSNTYVSTNKSQNVNLEYTLHFEDQLSPSLVFSSTDSFLFKCYKEYSRSSGFILLQSEQLEECNRLAFRSSTNDLFLIDSLVVNDQGSRIRYYQATLTTQSQLRDTTKSEQISVSVR